MPSEEEPNPSEFVAYPRSEKVRRKDPDPIPSDRWLARIGSFVVIASFLSTASRDPGNSGFLTIASIVTMVLMLSAYFVAGRGYRVGFGLTMTFGLFQAWGMYLLWSRGTLFRGSWYTEAVNAYMAFFALYCAARFFGFGRKRA